MLAYRHQFHAGNFADVFKHALLVRLLLALGRKDKPYLYLDTHAGIGRYDLAHPWAQKLTEYREGIERVWGCAQVPELIKPYLEAVRAENPGGDLRFYPGSPAIARRLVRPGDRIVLTELNRDDCLRLHELLGEDKQVHVECMDGYQAVKAFLPPRERRGLVLVDSSFDRAREFDRLTRALVEAHTRWATGVFALWYPLMEPHAVHAFERSVAATGIRKILKMELSVLPQKWSASLRGCGMLVINPPYRFEPEAAQIVAWLWQTLADQGQGGHTVSWLSPE
jgi:23S rRNA (adenine2030-N6)-methyltransferase